MIRREYLENIVNATMNHVIDILVWFVLAVEFVSVAYVDVIKDGPNRIVRVALTIVRAYLQMEYVNLFFFLNEIKTREITI